MSATYPVEREERLGDGPGPEWTIPALISMGADAAARDVLLVPPGPGEDENTACIHTDVVDTNGRQLGIDVDFHLLAAWCDQVRLERRAGGLLGYLSLTPCDACGSRDRVRYAPDLGRAICHACNMRPKTPRSRS